MASVIPNVIVEAIAAVSGAVVTVGIPLILAKLNKIGKVYTAVFGIEDVESMQGLVGVVRSHEDDIEELYKNQEEIKEGQSQIKQSIRDIQQSIKSRKSDKDGS